MSSKKGILLIGNYPPPFGGVATYIKDIHLSTLGDKYDLIILNIKARHIKNKFHGLVRIIGDVAGGLFNIFSLRKKIQILHIHGGSRTAFWKFVPFMKLGRWLNKDIVFHVHSVNPFMTFISHSKRAKNIMNYLLADQHVVVLGTGMEEFLSDYMDLQNIYFIPNSVDVEEWEREASPITNEELVGKIEGKTILLFLSLITRRKGVHDLVKIVENVVEKHPEAFFLFAGRPGDFSDELDAFIENCNFPDNIIYLKNVTDELKFTLVKHCHIFLLPTYGEGLPISILEAMVSKKPVITTPIAAIPEVVEDNVNGLFVEPGDQVALKEKINFLLDNPDLSKEMGENNVEKIRKVYSKELMIQRLDEMYSKILNERSKKNI